MTDRQPEQSIPARDGKLAFDDNEYMYIDDPGVVPCGQRALERRAS